MYEQLKKNAAWLKKSDLSAWETIALGGMSVCMPPYGLSGIQRAHSGYAGALYKISSPCTPCIWILQGAIAAAVTTPADVLKVFKHFAVVIVLCNQCITRSLHGLQTRAMTGATPAGEKIWVTIRNISAKEGPGALMKGCIPRMVRDYSMHVGRIA